MPQAKQAKAISDKTPTEKAGAGASAAGTKGSAGSAAMGSEATLGSETNAADRTGAGSRATPPAGGDAEALLKADHRKVEALFQTYEGLSSSDEKARCAKQICLELIVHSTLEEEIFYPACREKSVESDLLDEAQVEHDGAKLLIAELLNGSPGDAFYDAKVSVLSEYIKHHVGEEEKGSDGIFALAREAGVDMAGLGRQLQSRKRELMAELEGEALSAPPPRSLRANPRSQEETMARYGDDDRERDRYGRFSGGGGNGGGSFRGGRYGSNERERDDQGRFMSDDDRGYGRRSSSRHDDDDDRGYRGRASGSYAGSRGGSSRYDDDDGRGWYGDSEGHAEAARLGWEHRRGGGYGGGYGSGRDDDRGGRSSGGGYGSRSGYESRGGYGSGGGYESRGGYGGASRGRYEDDDRGYRGSSRGGSSREGSYREGSYRDEGQGGWFGDPEGHSEASRLGWEHRRGESGGRGQASRSGGYGSRSRYEDDDDGRGHGRGGWFGDPEGHSEASRRGWRNRD